jgi:hypothetical protein
MDRYQPNFDLLSTVKQLLKREANEKIPQYSVRSSDAQLFQSLKPQVVPVDQSVASCASDLDTAQSHWFFSRAEKVAHHFWVEYSFQLPVVAPPPSPATHDCDAPGAGLWITEGITVTEHYYQAVDSSAEPRLGPHLFKSPWRATGLCDLSDKCGHDASDLEQFDAAKKTITADVLHRRPDASNIHCRYLGTYARYNASKIRFVGQHSQQLASQMLVGLQCEDMLLPQSKASNTQEGQAWRPPQAVSPAIAAGIGSLVIRPLSSAELEAKTMASILHSSLQRMPPPAAMEKYSNASQQTIRLDTWRLFVSGEGTILLLCGERKGSCQAVQVPSRATILEPGAVLGPTKNHQTLQQLDSTTLTILEYLNLSSAWIICSGGSEMGDDLALDAVCEKAASRCRGSRGSGASVATMSTSSE